MTPKNNIAAACRNPLPQNPSASAIVRERLTVCVVHLDEDGFDFGALLLPAEDGFADAIHGDLGYRAGLLRTLVDHFENARGIPLVLDAALANRSDPLDQVIGHF